MAGRFIDELAGDMGWKTEKDTAYGVWQGYLFTVRSYAGITYTHVWLRTYGNITAIQLGEYFTQDGSRHRIPHAPRIKLAGIEIVQHFAPASEVKEMIRSFAAWLERMGARSGCARCINTADESALAALDGEPAYVCPECGGKTHLSPEAEFPMPEGNTAPTEAKLPMPGGSTTSTEAKPPIPGGSTTAAPAYQEGPVGIGGWLAAFMSVRFLIMTLLLIEIVIIAMNREMLYLHKAGYINRYSATLVLDLIAIAFEMTIMIFFLMKKIHFRTIFTIYALFSVVVFIFMSISIMSVITLEKDIHMLCSFAGVFVWVIYLFASKRVKNTFTRFERKERIKPEKDGFRAGGAQGSDTLGT